jgi:hypothetical protein
MRRKRFFNNALAPQVSGRITGVPDGETEIQVRIAIPRLNATYMTFLLAVMIVSAIYVTAVATLRVVGLLPDPPGIVWLVWDVLTVANVALVAYGRWSTRREGALVLGVIAQALEAREVSSTGALSVRT